MAPGRCRETAKPGAVPAGGSVADQVAAFAALAQFADSDPRAALVKLACRLARAADDDPANVVIARELRAMLTMLAEHPREPADRLDEIQARRFARRATSMLAQS